MHDSASYKPIRLRVLLFRMLLALLPALTWGAFLAYWVSPEETVVFQWLGLSLPALMVVNMLAVIYTGWQRRWEMLFPVLALAGGIFFFPLVWQWNDVKSDRSPEVRMASYNVRSFRMAYNMSSLEGIAALMTDNRVNTLCLQEVPLAYTEATLKAAFPKMKYVALSDSGGGKHRLAILSCYPITAMQTVSFPERPNAILAADVEVGKTKLRVVNCHLQTTNWNQLEAQASGGSGRRGVGSAARLISRNFRYRASQAAAVRSLVDQSPYGVVVAGDFNDSPVSYSYKLIKGELEDAFCEAGRGYGYSYRHLLRLFRIDYVLFSGSALKVSNYRTVDAPYSDHLPVFADFELEEKGTK